MPPVAGSNATRSGRGPSHHAIVLTLIVVASLIGVGATIALWASRQALETRAWTETSLKLLEDRDIQAALSTYLTDALFSSVDVKAELQTELPADAQALAVPMTGGLRLLADRAALAALQRPLVQRLWADANRIAHETLMAVLRGGSDVLSATGGVVTLNLAPLVEQVGEDLGLDARGKVPQNVGTVEVMRSENLARAQVLVRDLRIWGIVLPVLALGLLVLAVFLARGWRREALERVGIALAAVGVLVLVARGIAGAYVVDYLATSPSIEPAARSVWGVGTSLLELSAVALIAYGVLTLLGTWLAGPGETATRVRRAIGPVLRQRRYAYGVLAIVLGLVFWWDPTPGTSRLVPALILIVLAIAGVEALRTVSLRDASAERWERRLAA